MPKESRIGGTNNKLTKILSVWPKKRSRCNRFRSPFGFAGFVAVYGKGRNSTVGSERGLLRWHLKLPVVQNHSPWPTVYWTQCPWQSDNPWPPWHDSQITAGCIQLNPGCRSGLQFPVWDVVQLFWDETHAASNHTLPPAEVLAEVKRLPVWLT
jgi:hypothetical protein